MSEAISAVPRSPSQIGHPSEQLEIDGESIRPAENVAEDETNYPKGRKLFVIFSALMIIKVSVGLDTSIVAVTVPSLSDEFKSIDDIAWYATALRLVLCSFMFLSGKLYSVFKIKPLFVASVAIYQSGNLLCTLAPSSKFFIIGRGITGLGCAGILAGMFAILTRSFPLRKRPLYGGLLGGVETLASFTAPLVGGALIDGWTWRACFGINIPLGIAGLLVIAFYLEMPHQATDNTHWKNKIKDLDLLGTTVFIPALTFLLLALEWGGSKYGWNDGRVIATFGVFGVLIAVFGWLQYRRQDKATLPLRILRNRSILAGAWFASCANATLAVVEYYMSIYFQGVRGDSATRSGIYALPMILGICVALLSAGAATSWLGYYVPFMWLTTIISPIAVGFLTTINLETDLVKILVLQGLLGFAVGGGLMMPQVAAQTVLSSIDATIGYAIVQFGSQLGPVIYLSASTTLFTSRLTADIRMYAPETNVTSLEGFGLSDIRQHIGGDRLGAVLLGYDKTVMQTLYLPLALACMTIFGSLTMEWRSVKKKQS